MSGKRTSRATWSRALRVLVVVCVALGLSAAPGVASAAPPQVTPFVDCYRQNTDGTTTLIFGYTNTRKWTMTIDHGNNNYLYPSTYQGTQPEVFEEGTYRGTFSLTLTVVDLRTFRWELDRTSLTFAAGSTARCAPSTPLPALGNGTGLAIALVAGAAFGVLFVRRIVRRAAAVPPPAGVGG